MPFLDNPVVLRESSGEDNSKICVAANTHQQVIVKEWLRGEPIGDAGCRILIQCHFHAIAMHFLSVHRNRLLDGYILNVTLHELCSRIKLDKFMLCGLASNEGIS